jgi:hypothetical protein
LSEASLAKSKILLGIDAPEIYRDLVHITRADAEGASKFTTTRDAAYRHA